MEKSFKVHSFHYEIVDTYDTEFDTLEEAKGWARQQHWSWAHWFYVKYHGEWKKIENETNANK